jgi:hypothetical protein
VFSLSATTTPSRIALTIIFVRSGKTVGETDEIELVEFMRTFLPTRAIYKAD